MEILKKAGESVHDATGRVRGFFREVVSEFRKVNWPNQREVMGSTTVVIVVVVVLAVFLAAVDIGLSRLVGFILPR